MIAREHTIWSATPTPFNEDGSLDDQSIARLVAHHIALGVTGLLVGGTCGEGPFMPNAQRAQLFRTLKACAGDRLKIVAQVSDTSAARVCENVLRASDAGADCVVIAPPWLVADFCNEAYLRRYFSEPIEMSPVPVGLYPRLPMGATELSPELWCEIAAHPKVTLIKDSTGCPVHRAAFCELRKTRPELTLLTGDEFNVMRAVEAGYDGCLLGSGILNAGLIGRGLEALAAADRVTADQWQARSNAFLKDLFRDDITAWMSGLKYALNHVGLFSTRFSHLEFPLNQEDRTRIKAALEREAECVTVG